METSSYQNNIKNKFQYGLMIPINKDQLKSVVILTNCDRKPFLFLNNLGIYTPITEPGMCMQRTPTRLFNYQMFNILVSDNKLADYLTTRNGIIILVDELNEKIVQRINHVIGPNADIPILIVLESSDDYQNILQKSIHSPNHLYVHIKNANDITNSHAWFNSMLTQVLQTPLPPVVTSPSNTPTKFTSDTIPTTILVDQFQNRTLPLEIWDHYGRLRIVYYALRTYGLNNTIDKNGWLCTNWIRYKTSIGHGDLWHYSLTRFWAHILFNIMYRFNYSHESVGKVAYSGVLTEKYDSFKNLYNDNPIIHSGRLFEKYYTRERLFSPHSRDNWVEPDLMKI
jgi:hypothetical protein